MSARPGRITVLRDITAYAGGWVLMLKQAGILFTPPAEVNEVLVAIAGALIGVPGIAQIIAWRTGGSPSEPAPSPQPPSSVTPSPER